MWSWSCAGGERRLEFETLRQRALCRLEHLGLTIRPGSVHEEEYCYIPMGGNLPDLAQRVRRPAASPCLAPQLANLALGLAQVIAVGGAAATVHPSTGYQLCRMLASSTDLASTISAELKRSDFDPDAAAAAAYRTLWPNQLRY